MAHDKRATGAICSFSQANLFRSQKTIVSLKNRWANSQPWGILYSKFYFHYKIAKSLKKVKFYVSEIKYRLGTSVVHWPVYFFSFLSAVQCTVLVQVLSSGVSQGEDPHLVTVAVQVLSCGVSPYLVTVAVQVLSCGISQGEGPDQSIVLASSHLKRTNWKPKAGPLFCVLQCVSSDETNTNGLFDTYAVS